MKENEATVKRYRKMIEDEKVFAVTKLAKDLLEVRDALRMAFEHSDAEGIKTQAEIEVLRDLFVSNLEG